MSQLLISYFLRQIVKVANINPSDVNYSVLHGTIELRRVGVCEELLKNIPLELTIEAIPYVSIKLLNPRSVSTPVCVTIHGVHVKIPLHALQTFTERDMALWETFTEEMLHVDEEDSEESNLSSSLNPSNCPHRSTEEYWDVEHEGMSSCEDDEKCEVQSLASSEASNLDDADLASCRSDANSDVLKASTSFKEETLISDVEEGPSRQGGGMFSFFKKKWQDSKERIMDRRVEVTIENTVIEIVVDERLNVSCMGSIRSASAVVEPTSTMHGEVMRPIQVIILDSLITALFGQQKACILRVEKIETNLALVTAKGFNGPFRLNSSVKVNEILVNMDEASVGVLARSAEPIQRILSIPSFCHPHFPLRKLSSRWPYALSCTQSYIVDLRKRYNFNSSHIRFFCNSRRRYLRLLSECYQDLSIGRRAKDLAELEVDIRFPDVIYFLRQLMQEKYCASRARTTFLSSEESRRGSLKSLSSHVRCNASSPNLEINSVEVERKHCCSTRSSVQPLLLTHVAVLIVRVRFPRQSAVVLRQISVVSRRSDFSFEIGDLGCERADHPSCFVKVSKQDNEMLMKANVRSFSSNDEIKVVFQPMCIHVSLPVVHEISRPLLDIIVQYNVLEVLSNIRLLQSEPKGREILADIPSIAATGCGDVFLRKHLQMNNVHGLLSSSPNFGSMGARKLKTVFIIVPSLSLTLEHFLVLLRNASFTLQQSSGQPHPQFGVNADELSVRCGKHTPSSVSSSSAPSEVFLLFPISVQMENDDSIHCSSVRIEVNLHVFESIHSICTSAMMIVPTELFMFWAKPTISSTPTLVGQPSFFAPSLSALSNVSTRCWKKPKLGQIIELEEIIISFDLLDVVARAGKLKAFPVVLDSPTDSDNKSLLSVSSSVISARDKNIWGAQNENGCGWCIAIEGMGITIGQSDSFSIVLCTENTSEATIFRNTSLTSSTIQECSRSHDKKSVSSRYSSDTEKEKLRVFFLPSRFFCVDIYSITVTQNSPAFSSPFQLTSFPQLSVRIHQQDLSLKVKEATLLEGLAIKDFWLTVRGEPLAYHDRPYIASTLSISSRIVEINLQKIGKFVWDPLVLLITHIDSVFARGDLISMRAYHTFYSGFSHALISVEVKDCPLMLSDTAKLIVTLEHHSLKEEGTRGEPFSYSHRWYVPASLLNSFSTLSSSKENSNSPFILFSDVKALAQYFALGNFILSLTTTPEVAKAEVRFRVSELTIVIPMAKMEVWNKKVLLIPSPVFSVTVEEVAVLSLVELETEGCAKASKYPIARVLFQNFLLEKVPGGISVNSFRKNEDGDSNPSSTTLLRRRSSSSTSLSVDDHIFLPYPKVSVEKAAISVHAEHSLVVYRHFLLLSEQFTGASSIFTHHTIIHSTVSDRLFVLEETGDIFFESGKGINQVIVVECCTFRSSVTDRCIVVMDGTTVLFRNCVFQHHGQNFLRGSGTSSFFLCENCSDILLSSTAPSNRSPAGAQEKFQFELKQTNLELQLLNRTVCYVRNQVVEFSATNKPSLRYFFLHFHEGQAVLTDDGVDTIVSSQITVKSEISFKPKRKALSMNVTVSLGEVTIPLIFHVLPHLTQIFTLPLKSPPPRRYVVPQPPSKEMSKFLWDEWKVLFSFAVVPINISLRSGCTIAKLHLSNGYIWSILDSLERQQATLEGHFGFSHLSILDFETRCFRPITRVPLDINIAGEAQDMYNISTEVKVSLGELTCTSSQLRLLATLIQYSTELNTASIRVVNHTGDEVELGGEGSPINLVVEAGAAREYQMKNFPFDRHAETVVRIGKLKIKGEESFCGPVAIYGLDQAVSFATVKLVLEDGFDHVLVKTITDRFVHEIQLFTLVHIKNETKFLLRFTSLETSTRELQSFEIQPYSLSCIPSSMMDAKDVKMSIIWQGCESTAESLWEQECLLQFISAAEFHHPLPEVKALRFACMPQGVSTTFYILTSYELSWKSALFLFVTPAQPEIQSNVLFPVEVRVLRNGRQEMIREETLSPGSVFQLYDANPGFSYEVILRTLIGNRIFESKDPLNLTDPTSEHGIEMKSAFGTETQGSFELRVAPYQKEGSRLHGWILKPSHLCYIESRCNRRVQLLDLDGKPVGSIDSAGIPAFPCSSAPSEDKGGYVPLKVPILLKLDDTQASGPFEITGNEGNVVECPFEESFEGVLCVALLRPVSCDFFVAVEVLSPVVFKNKGLEGIIYLRHEVHQRGSEDCVFSRTVSVPADSELSVSYFALAAPGFINYFSFSVEPPFTRFSHRIETNLAPGTSWSGQLECGGTTHRVVVSKNGPYDPAIISVGPPQDLRFQLINLTNADFTEAAAMTIRRCTSSISMLGQDEAHCAQTTGAWDQNAIILSRPNGARYRVRVAEDSVQEVEPDVFIYTIVGREITTVVICGWNLNNGEASCRLAHPHLTIIGSVACSSTSFTLYHERSPVFQIAMQGINSLVTTSGSYSTQITLTGLSLSTRRSGEVFYVVEPVEISASLRDAKLSTTATSIESFHLTVTPVAIVISDYFLGKLLPILQTCANYSHTSFRHQWENKKLLRFSSQKDTASIPKRVYVESATISPVALEVSWDRSVSATSSLQGFLPWWASLIPSLHHASLSVPQVDLRRVSRDSIGLLISNLQTLYIKELLTQIPRFVGTVGLFKKNTSILNHIASKVTSLFSSSSRDDDIPEGFTRLI